MKRFYFNVSVDSDTEDEKLSGDVIIEEDDYKKAKLKAIFHILFDVDFGSNISFSVKEIPPFKGKNE